MYSLNKDYDTICQQALAELESLSEYLGNSVPSSFPDTEEDISSKPLELPTEDTVTQTTHPTSASYLSRELNISKDDVRAQLESMGYSPSALPDEMLDEFISELKVVYKAELAEFLEDDDIDALLETTDDDLITGNEDFPDNEDEISPIEPPTPAVAWAQIEREETYVPSAVLSDTPQIQTSPRQRDTHTEATFRPADYQRSLSEKLASLDLSNVRRKVKRQQQQLDNRDDYSDYSNIIGVDATERSNIDEESYSSVINDDSEAEYDDYTSPSTGSSSEDTPERRRYRSGYIRGGAPPARRKHDPVTRYHQHQARWQRDGFLQRMVNKKPVVAPVASVPSRPTSTGYTQRPRHNYADMRPTYVVPTTKKRDDLVWRNRNRMAYVGQA
ncbi:hypothetical protein HDU85_004575 [Gaertneriomyces sp. JEL0708]|nr:hypothetical protein HDU85_004575 [Gaertneriomyces sp. JEL0708]